MIGHPNNYINYIRLILINFSALVILFVNSINNSSLYIRDNHKINHQFISIVLIKDSSFVGNSVFLMLINNKFENLVIQ